MDLIRHSQSGDAEAFAELFDRYKNLVFRAAYLILGSAHEIEMLANDAREEAIRVAESLIAAQ